MTVLEKIKSFFKRPKAKAGQPKPVAKAAEEKAPEVTEEKPPEVTREKPAETTKPEKGTQSD